MLDHDVTEPPKRRDDALTRLRDLTPLSRRRNSEGACEAVASRTTTTQEVRSPCSVLRSEVLDSIAVTSGAD